MATYVVTNSEQDTRKSGRRFKTRREAEDLYQQEVERDAFVRLVRWDWSGYGERGRLTEIKRHNGAR